MARCAVEVTYKSEDANRLPDRLVEAASLFVDLMLRGVVDAVGKRLRVRRQGGYSGLDVFLLLLAYLSAGPGQGVRPFWLAHHAHLGRLAALAGRRSLMSPAALSRALAAVETDLLRAEGTADWLLWGVSGGDRVMSHPAAQTYDACGRAWHVFDLDPTVTTLRHRALPESDELPEARRRSEQTGSPGYSGRKRGDLQFRRVTVQHAGSGVWVHAHLSPGNGYGVRDLELAAEAMVATCSRLRHPLERTLVRTDGEFGHVPGYSVFRSRGLSVLSRLTRQELYEALVSDTLILHFLLAENAI